MNIKDIRTRKGLTQAEVASALGAYPPWFTPVMKPAPGSLPLTF